MKTRSLRAFAPSVATGCLFAAPLLGGACVAPEFSKVEALEGSGGAGGAITASTSLGSSTTSTSTHTAAATTADSTTESSNGAGGSGTDTSTGGPGSTNGEAGGSASTLTTTEGSGGTASACGDNETDCSGQCVDIRTSVANCGACGVACGALEECIGGSCQCVDGYTACSSGCAHTASDSQNCGGCGAVCDPGEVCSQGRCGADCAGDLTECNGNCVDTNTNREYCGSCYIACDPGFECSAGSCECEGGLTNCNSYCFDTDTSNQHCGGCFRDCASGQTCSGGSCECSGGAEACGDECVDTQTSNAHCGACNRACGERESCSGGSCECSDEYEACSGSCVSLDDDADNCGGCGNTCGSGQVCAGGDCCNATMLLLGDEDATGNAAMRAAYQNAGMAVTLIDGGVSSYAGTPAADDFQVVVASFGRNTIDVEMPDAGQSAIAAAHAAGTGYIAFELASWQAQAGLNPSLAPLTLLSYGTSTFQIGLVTLVSAGHPIWDGVPTSFTPALGLGTTVGNLVNGGVAIATCAGCEYGGEYYGAAVVVRDASGGRIVHFANEGNASDVHEDPNVLKVAVNAALWAAGCK